MSKTQNNKRRNNSPKLSLVTTLLFALGLSVQSAPTQAAHINISAQPIELFQAQPVGSKIGGLIWRGGLVLSGPENFGGISGLTFLSTDRWVAITDRGQFISGRIQSEQNSPVGLTAIKMQAITNSNGNPLPPNYSRDAEAIDTIYRDGKVAAIRISFENLTRVADFELNNGRPIGPASEVVIPTWLTNLRTNQSLESACIATDTSPIAGSTLLITEDERNEDNNHSAWLLGRNDKGPLALEPHAGFSPTDCAFLPNGDLLILERGTEIFSFKMQVRQIPAAQVAPNALLKGEVILSANGSDIDNMEALAVRLMENGATNIVIMSDDNFNDWERTLWLEFELPN